MVLSTADKYYRWLLKGLRKDLKAATREFEKPDNTDDMNRMESIQFMIQELELNPPSAANL